MLRNLSVVVLLCVVLDVRANPFAMADKYIDETKNGIEELFHVAKHYEFVEEKFDHEHYNETRALMDAEEYDFIVVGGGTSGAILASRLSEVPEWHVLLLEAGAPETETTKIPALKDLLKYTPYNWGYKSSPQNTSCLGMVEHKCALDTPKILGGSSSFDNMIYVRGNAKDYDHWADNDNKGWCYDDVLPFFKKIEDAHFPHMDRKLHHQGGPIHIQHPQYFSGHLADHVLKAAEEHDYHVVDYNGKKQIGFSYPQLTLKKGKRVSTADAYLTPAHERKNLVVRPLSHVTKISISPHTKEANGVRYLHDGKLFIAKATKEVIITAGPINTPKLLLLSGVGPKSHLEELGIETIEELDVGHNLKDHVGYIGLNFIYEHHIDQKHDPHQELVDYLRLGEGPLTKTGADVIGFIKSHVSKIKADYPDISLYFVPTKFSEELGRYHHLNTETSHALYEHLLGKTGFTVIVGLNHPKSSGFVKLHSKDPLHYPFINYHQLSDEEEHDIETLAAGIADTLKILQSPSIEKLGVVHANVTIPTCVQHEGDKVEYQKCLIRHLTVSLNDYTGTARMGPKTDKTAVVDQHLRVYGIHKLRVADSSIIPVTMTGKTIAVKILIGEMASHLIKADWI